MSSIARPLRKNTRKELLEKFAKGDASFTPSQLKIILHGLVLNKRGEVSPHTVKILEPLNAALEKDQLPHVGLCLVALEKLNQPFFRRKKREGEANEQVSKKKPGTKIVVSTFVTKEQARQAKSAEQMNDHWRKSMADSYKTQFGCTKHIKSKGNGL